MESNKDKTVIIQNVLTFIDQETFLAFLASLDVQMKGFEYVNDENGGFSGTCKILFENAAQA